MTYVPYTHPNGITARFYPHELERLPPDQQDRRDAYQRKHPPPQPVVVTEPPSVFNGIGVFNAWESTATRGLNVDWQAVQLDPEGDRKYMQATGRVFGWQARPSQYGVSECLRMGLAGYIGQAENEGEYEACLGLSFPAGYPHAMVGNVGGWWDSARVRAAGYELIQEAYECADPGVLDRLDSKGYPVASTLFGVYDASGERPGVGRRVPLAEYLSRYPTANWSVYLAETLTAADRDLMA